MKYIDRLKQLLKREPTPIEIEAFTVMWSEHCGYCHTKPYIKQLPGVGIGSNAGVLLLGDSDYVVAFKIESHNHPSAVEPYNGAATGVGGIIRDILAMGLRPTAVLDSLHMHFVNQGIISGISDYGNAIGVPTVGGELRISDLYRYNPLVNVMACGVGKAGEVLPSKASSVNQVIVVFGAPTGRDGIHGASFASRHLAEKEEKIHIQVGDPFMEKLLIEAFLKMNELNLIDGAQDLGAGGVLSATSELAGKGGLGITVYLDRIPLREPDMEGWEILISESQERMAVVTTPDRVNKILEVVKEYMLYGDVVAELNDSGIYKAIYRGQTILEVPVSYLTEAPIEPAYDYVPPASLPDFSKVSIEFCDVDATDVFEQYDYMVGTDTVVPPGFGASVMRIKGTNLGYVLAVHSRADLATVCPYYASFITLFETARKIVALSGKPLGITDGINYGDPDKNPKDLAALLVGLRDSSLRLNLPVVSGNASLYNTFKDKDIPPTLIIGMVGVVENVNKVILKNKIKRAKLYEAGFCGFDVNRERLLWDFINYCNSKNMFVIASATKFPGKTLKTALSYYGYSLKLKRDLNNLTPLNQKVWVLSEEPLNHVDIVPVVEVGEVC